MKKKLNILHLESSKGWGGQEIRILNESIKMRERGHNVLIVVEKNGGLFQKATNNGIKSYEVRFKKIFWFYSIFKLFYIIKKNKIDLINTHSSSDAWLGGILAKIIFKIPVVRTRHLSTKIKKGLNSKLLYGYLADFVVTTSTEIIPMISTQANKDISKIKCIPTGLDIEKIKFSKNEVMKFKKDFNIEKDDFLVGTACFMRSWKGIDDLLKAAKILENEKNIKFLIIGGGHEETYRKMSRDLNLKNVIFTSHLENPFYAIESLDVFTLLSTAHEGVSQSSLQAAFLKKPLITTETGGLKEVCINNYSGIIVPTFSPENVAKAIMRIIKNNELRLQFSNNAFEISKKFTIANMINNMEDVYFKII